MWTNVGRCVIRVVNAVARTRKAAVMHSEELADLGADIVELAAAWPGTGLDSVGEFATRLSEHLSSEQVCPEGKG
jgi:hypothetical protein